MFQIKYCSEIRFLSCFIWHFVNGNRFQSVSGSMGFTKWKNKTGQKLWGQKQTRKGAQCLKYQTCPLTLTKMMFEGFSTNLWTSLYLQPCQVWLFLRCEPALPQSLAPPTPPHQSLQGGGICGGRRRMGLWLLTALLFRHPKPSAALVAIVTVLCFDWSGYRAVVARSSNQLPENSLFFIDVFISPCKPRPQNKNGILIGFCDCMSSCSTLKPSPGSRDYTCWTDKTRRFVQMDVVLVWLGPCCVNGGATHDQ